MYALLITDSSDDAAIFSMVLQRTGLAVTPTKTLEQGIQSWLERQADLILLALSTPDPKEQVRYIRSETQTPLVIVLDEVNERLHVDLLKMGADLVVTSPFSVKILSAQVEVLLRRSSGIPTFTLPNLSVKALTLNPATRTVEVAGKSPQRLTHLEFRLLYTLMTNRGQVIPTDTIVERVWGYTDQGDRDLVRGLVSRLRTKIEKDAHHPEYIITMPGIGYIFKVGEE